MIDVQLDTKGYRSVVAYNTKYIERIEKEKCELLGIIQAKDEIIEKMKCCENCSHYSHTYEHCYPYQNCKSLSNWKLAE